MVDIPVPTDYDQPADVPLALQQMAATIVAVLEPVYAWRGQESVDGQPITSGSPPKQITNLTRLKGADVNVAVANGAVTVQKAGFYLVSGTVSFAENATGLRFVEIRDGAGNVLARETSHASSNIVRVGTTKPVLLAEGAAISLWCLHEAGTTLRTYAPDTDLAVIRIPSLIG